MAEMLCMRAPLFVGVCLCAGVRLHSHTKIDRRYDNNSFNKAPCVASSLLTLPRWALWRWQSPAECQTENTVRQRPSRSSKDVQSSSFQKCELWYSRTKGGQNNRYTLTQSSATAWQNMASKTRFLRDSYKGVEQPVPCSFLSFCPF